MRISILFLLVLVLAGCEEGDLACALPIDCDPRSESPPGDGLGEPEPITGVYG